MNTRRHNAAKRWAPGASFLLATALLLLVLSPGAHAAAPLGAVQSDAVLWLLREMQDEARTVSVSALQTIAPDEEIARDESESSLASTRALENAARVLFTSRKTGGSTFLFAPQNARDLSPEITTRATFASPDAVSSSTEIALREVSTPQKNAAKPFAHRLTTVAFSIPASAPRAFVPSSLREYSRQHHSAAFRNGVRSNAFPQ